MDSNEKIMHISCAELSKRLCEAIRKREEFELFEANEADTILVDGVQYLVERPAIREELFRVFDGLHRNGKQIVLAFGRT